MKKVKLCMLGIHRRQGKGTCNLDMQQGKEAVTLPEWDQTLNFV